ncbi:NAD(P)H-dependent oxidoreductase [Acinetobacter sp. Tr-809]|uniref:NAD(P)H-dependent oxidoreductase n=1 Tax=Acinetobacter sp. Tr-809 TaxID=2608324 RepID=UPI00141E39D1|nr:NAD(P)H-dependent oxidoreductase [Acinetobacter sp. Tr-809]NIE96277.1 NAD(P)H-dependent oxidoreductase [Acinetobacter sp. Tr-809]
MSNSNKPQHALIVITHPDTQSLSHQIAQHISHDLTGKGISVEIVDLNKEGFQAAMTLSDIEAYRGRQALDADVQFEQARFDRADMVYFIFPVYWWSVPAVLKGWFERVFSQDWAYKYDEQGNLSGILKNIPVKLIGTAAGTQSGYDRHGYTQAIHKQIVEGIFAYCGIDDVQTSMLFKADFTQVDDLKVFFEELDQTVLNQFQVNMNA